MSNPGYTSKIFNERQLIRPVFPQQLLKNGPARNQKMHKQHTSLGILVST